MSARVEHGDCREVIRSLPDASVHACVTDPPYSLVSIQKRFSKPGSAEAQYGRDGAYKRASAGFMGKQWDTGETAFDPAFWAEVYRVLKPGAHLIAFGGTRTYHRLACAIEDAGFEIRDQIGWLYGSGFPKSHDVSKGIDKAAGAEREVVGIHYRHGGGDEVSGSMSGPLGTSSELPLTAPATAAAARQWQGWGTALKPAWESIVLARKPLEGTVAANVVKYGTGGLNIDACRIVPHGEGRGSVGREAPTERDRQHAVLGVRPAHGQVEKQSAQGEMADDMRRSLPISGDERSGKSELAGRCMDGQEDGLSAREHGLPIGQRQGAATNASAEGLCGAQASHGEAVGPSSPTGGACPSSEWGQRRQSARESDEHGLGGTLPRASRNGAPPVGNGPSEPAANHHASAKVTGRWPANICHDGSEEVLAAFPDVGVSTGGQASRASGYGEFGGGSRQTEKRDPGFGDSGSAARFFYTAKADADDRLGSKHPTVKPVDLMAYLCRLVTPPGGTVLDPFAGSGTTGMACLREGFDCILIEREAEYIADIHRRLDHVAGADTPLFSAAEDARANYELALQEMRKR